MSRCNRHGREGCLCPDGAYTREEAQQRAGLCGPPPSVVHDRPALTARLTYLAVGLTDAGLSALVERAETLTVDHARPLTSGALAKAQQEREAAAEQKQPEPDTFGFYRWPNVPCECPPDADPGERCSALWMCCDLAARSKQPHGRARCRGAFDVRREARETAEAFKPPAKPLGQRFTEADAEIQRRAAPVEQAAPMAGKVCVPERGGL